MTKILTLLMGVVVMMAVGVAQKTEVSHGSGSTVVSNQPTITKQSSSHSPPTHPPPPPPTKGHVTTLGHSSHSFHDKTLGRSSITEHQHQQHHSTQQTNHHKKKKKHHHHQKKHPNSTGEDVSFSEMSCSLPVIQLLLWIAHLRTHQRCRSKDWTTCDVGWCYP